MTIEEQKKADTAKAEAEAKAKAEKEKADAEHAEGKSEDDEAGDDIDNNPDYEAELQRERKAREEAEKALADSRFKESERKRKAKEAGEDPDEDEEDKPLTKKELQAILAAERQATLKESQSDRITEIAKSMSESESEANLVVEIHKNRTWPSHLSLTEQVEEAYAIANRKKLISKNSEMARALRSKDFASKDFVGTHRDGMEGSAPKMSTNDTAAYTRAGFKFDAKSKLWKKTLPNGKTLNKDPRTKRTFIS